MSLVANQPPALPSPADAAGDNAVRAALAALARLVAEAQGEVLPVRIGATLPNGLTQVLAGARQVAIPLPQPLPPGTPVHLSLSPAGAIHIAVPPARSAAAPPPAPTPPAVPAAPLRTAASPTPAPPPPRDGSLAQEGMPAGATRPLVSAAPTIPAPATAGQPQTLQSPAPRSAPAGPPAGAAPPAGLPAGPQANAAAPLSRPPQAPVPTGMPQGPAVPTPAPLPSSAPPPPSPPAAPLRPANAVDAARAYASVQASTSAGPVAAHAAPDPQHAAVATRLDLVERQQDAAPLLARLVAVAARPDLPVEVRQAALKVLAGRVPLDRGAPDGTALRAALAMAGGAPADVTPALPQALEQLRSALGRLIGAGAALRRPAPHAGTPPPPLPGDPPEAARPQPALAADGDRASLAARLAADTDGAIARHRLLALPAPPAEARPTQPAPTTDLRIEVPMLLAGETGMVQFVLEREARRPQQKRERGWRMRFAMNFTATGEVGADVGLVGSRAQVALWAGRGDVADALEAMADELAPALARHGLSLAGFQLRRGALPHADRSPGRLVDGAR